MKTIWKQSIPVTDKFTLKLKINDRILCVQTIDNLPYIWFTTDTEEQMQKLRDFRIYGTGHPVQENELHSYIGTFQILKAKYYEKDPYVFHLFEGLK